MKLSDQLYSMKLGDQIYWNYDQDDRADCVIQRVPGGWNYIYESSSVFVPFNNEFQGDNNGGTIK
jgi:hypothetical protein